MKKFWFGLFILVFSIMAQAGQNLDENISLEDEMGVKHLLREFSAHSFIFVPVYAKCSSSCPVIIEKLEHDLPLSKADLNKYRVLVFSFDPEDSVAALKEFREMHQIPPLWMIARATPAMTLKLMDSLGIKTVIDGVTREFTHPDVIAIIGPPLWTSKLLKSAEISPSKIQFELQAADAHESGLSKESLAYLLPIFILGTIASVFYFATKLLRSS